MEDATLSPASDEAYTEPLDSPQDNSFLERKKTGSSSSGSILKVPSKHYGKRTATGAPERNISFAEGTKTLSQGSDGDEDEIAVVSGRRGCCILQ